MFCPCPCLWGDHPPPVIGCCHFYTVFCHLCILKNFFCPSQFWSASIPTELWLRRFSLSFLSGKQHLCIPPMSRDLASTGHIPSFFALAVEDNPCSEGQDGLLPCLPDFQHFGIACSQAFRRWCLESDKHWWTLAPSKVSSEDLLVPQAA